VRIPFKESLRFKDTKTGEPRVVKIPEEALAKLEAHRNRQTTSARNSAQTIAATLI
jgi:hypothetical protein